MHAEKPREIAIRILQRAGTGAAWVEELLETELARAGAGMSPADRGLARELTFGMVRWQGTLDWLIARRTDGRPQKPVLQLLLRLGLYQLFWLDRVPDHAAVHETVELARRLGFGAQAGFVNAVLRGCVREREAIARDLEDLKTRQPHLGWSHPEWLCQRWAARWGTPTLGRLLEWNNTPPSVHGRVNTLRTTPEQLAAQFEREGVLFTPRPYDWVSGDAVFALREHPPLPTLPSFQQGLFYVQDPSTLLAPRWLDPRPGERVLDLCAAPGGKTTYLAQLMNNQGTVVAHDSDPRRLRRVVENCNRLGVTCVSTTGAPIDVNPRAGGTEAEAEAATRPASETTAFPGGSFDRILIDAPCSNTGVMRRRVELRWRVRPEELARLAGLQLDLLRTAAPSLKPGGTLVYSTCSLEPEENGELIRRFLETTAGFQLEGERQLLPFVEQVDGAYVARLVKSSGA